MRIFVMIIIALVMMGCTSGEMSSIGAYGNEHLIELYSGGVKVRSWTSTGKVDSEAGSDGYYFRDKETKMFTTVSGDVVITALP